MKLDKGKREQDNKTVVSILTEDYIILMEHHNGRMGIKRYKIKQRFNTEI